MHLVLCSRCEHCALIRIQKHRVNVHKSSNKKPREQRPGRLSAICATAWAEGEAGTVG